jgi:hypothetical protein
VSVHFAYLVCVRGVYRLRKRTACGRRTRNVETAEKPPCGVTCGSCLRSYNRQKS